METDIILSIISHLRRLFLLKEEYRKCVIFSHGLFLNIKFVNTLTKYADMGVIGSILKSKVFN